MKKVLTLICLLVITTGVASAHPIVPQNHHKYAPAPQKAVPPPKPMPVAQVPVLIPPYGNSYGYGYNSPSVTFSLGNIDVTVGL